MDLRGMRIVLIIITSVVLALFMVTPFLMSAGSVVGLSGTPIIMDFGHIWADLDPISAFTYGFGVAAEAFENAGVKLITLTNYEAVVEAAKETNYISEEVMPTLKEWRANPSEWRNDLK